MYDDAVTTPQPHQADLGIGPTPEESRLLTLDDVASEAGISKQAVVNARARDPHVLPSSTTDGRPLFTREVVDLWLTQRTAPARRGQPRKLRTPIVDELLTGFAPERLAVLAGAYLSTCSLEQQFGMRLPLREVDITERVRAVIGADLRSAGWVADILNADLDPQDEALLVVLERLAPPGATPRQIRDLYETILDAVGRRGILAPERTDPALVSLLRALSGSAGAPVDPSAGFGDVLFIEPDTWLGSTAGGTPTAYDSDRTNQIVLSARNLLHDTDISIRGDFLQQRTDQEERRDLLRVACQAPHHRRVSSGRRVTYRRGKEEIEREIALAHRIARRLAEDGRAAIAVSAAAVTMDTTDEVRTDLVESGRLAAVVALPESMVLRIRFPITVLVMASSRESRGTLFVDAGLHPAAENGLSPDLQADIVQVVDKYLAGQLDGVTRWWRTLNREDVLRQPLLPGLLLAGATISAAEAREDVTSLLGSIDADLEGVGASALRSTTIAAAQNFRPAQLAPLHQVLDEMRIAQVPGIRPSRSNSTAPITQDGPFPGWLPLLRLEDLRFPGLLRARQQIQMKRPDNVETTRPYDVVMSRTGEARVDTTGGNAVLAPLVILRTGGTHELPTAQAQRRARVLAAAISSPTASRSVASTGAGRTTVEQMLVPELQTLDSEFADALLAIETARSAAADLIAHLDALASTVGDALFATPEQARS